ncbi:MAG TPA: cytochrome c-type biogenesis protein [Casimicrobiaceae bacterium]|nr:cytochrome c-type biogenesis protein [Casimicrobiaceae bacterium]
MIAARRALLGVLFAAAASAWAAAPTAPSGDALDARLKRLETELRCLVCQNQTLADSNADLAGDLRKEVRELALAGKSDDEIRAYLVARYGDFVLYDPPLKAITSLLWLGPFALLAGGAVLWWAVLRRRARGEGTATGQTDAEAAAHARALLEREEGSS